MMLIFLLNVILPLFLFGRISNFMKGKGYSGKEQEYTGYDWYGRQYGGTYSDATDSIAADYETLGISPDASDSDVKAAYKCMAKKFHPDKFATESPEVQKDAEEKFKKIQSAYDSINKRRNIKR